MEEVIWIEVLHRHRAVAARYRCNGPEIRIGRGYDNDVVIDDPYVAAQHVRVSRDAAGALVAEDIGSANGLFADRGTTRLERMVLDGDRLIRIGNTYLRIRDAGHVVPREQPHAPPRHLWPVALVLAVVILGANTLFLWLNETGEPKFSTYLYPLLGAVAWPFGWISIWAVLSRIFGGHAHFDRHALIALSGLLVYSLSSWLSQFAAFALSWSTPAAYLYIGGWCLLAGACYLHSRDASRSPAALRAAVIAALLVVAIVTQALTQSEDRSNTGQQSYMHHLLPPTLRLTRLQSETDFFARIEQLKPGLDHDRTAAQSAPAAAANDEDND